MKSAVDQQVEALRIQLQATADTEIERLKNALQMAADERRVRFSNLHETRARKIAELYERLVAQSLACQRYVHQMNEEERHADFYKLEEQFRELYSFIETIRIYLPEHICRLLDDVLDHIRKPVIAVWVYGAVDAYAPPQYLQQRGEELMKAVSAFEKDIPAAKKVLEAEFRKMLGVEDPRRHLPAGSR